MRELEKYLDNPPADGPKLPLKSEPFREGLDPHVESMLDVLREHFGTKINITQSAKKGKISLEFYSIEDFNRIMNRMGIKQSR